MRKGGMIGIPAAPNRKGIDAAIEDAGVDPIERAARAAAPITSRFRPGLDRAIPISIVDGLLARADNAKTTRGRIINRPKLGGRT